MGVQVWLMTSRQTEPELTFDKKILVVDIWVIDFVEETYRWAFVGILLRQV